MSFTSFCGSLVRGSIVGSRSGFAFGSPSRTNNEKAPDWNLFVVPDPELVLHSYHLLMNNE